MLGGEAMRYTVTQGFHVGLTGDALEAHLDEVLQALFDVGAETSTLEAPWRRVTSRSR
jgi:hypothetical protein